MAALTDLSVVITRENTRKLEPRHYELGRMSESKQENTQCLIVGAGLGGLSAAIAFARRGVRVMVSDPICRMHRCIMIHQYVDHGIAL